MPKGIPVGTVAIGIDGAINSALFDTKSFAKEFEKVLCKVLN